VRYVTNKKQTYTNIWNKAIAELVTQVIQCSHK